MGRKNAFSVPHSPLKLTNGKEPTSQIVVRLALEPRQMASLSVGWLESGQGGREVDV